MEDKLFHKATPEAAAQFILLPKYTETPQDIRGGVITNTHFKIAVRNFHALDPNR